MFSTFSPNPRSVHIRQEDRPGDCRGCRNNNRVSSTFRPAGGLPDAKCAKHAKEAKQGYPHTPFSDLSTTLLR